MAAVLAMLDIKRREALILADVSMYPPFNAPNHAARWSIDMQDAIFMDIDDLLIWWLGGGSGTANVLTSRIVLERRDRNNAKPTQLRLFCGSVILRMSGRARC